MRRRRRRRLVLGLALVALLGLTAGCTSHHPPASSRSVGQITSDIDAANFDQPASLHALDLDARDPHGAAAAAKVLAGSPKDAALWGAVYVYVSTATDPAPLHKYLTEANLDVRAMAATGAVLDGDKDGFPVLVDLLGHTGYLRGSVPVTPVWQYAGLSLIRATGDASRGPAEDATAVQIAAAQARWQAWWQASGSKLHYDGASQVWGNA